MKLFINLCHFKKAHNHFHEPFENFMNNHDEELNDKTCHVGLLCSIEPVCMYLFIRRQGSAVSPYPHVILPPCTCIFFSAAGSQWAEQQVDAQRWTEQKYRKCYRVSTLTLTQADWPKWNFGSTSCTVGSFTFPLFCVHIFWYGQKEC